MHIRRAILVLLLTAAASVATAASAPIEPFLGSYYGVGLVDDVDGDTRPVTIRETSVVIDPLAGGGFVLTWSAIHSEALNAPKMKTTRLRFMPAGKPGRYVSAGGAGTPTERVGAEIDGSTLRVFIEDTDPAGNRILQQWDRTLAGKTMVLDYRRVQQGAVTRVVRLTLGKLTD